MLTVSHSQLGVFDRCEFSWHLNYQLGWVPEKKKSYLELGTIIDDMWNIHYSNLGKDTELLVLEYVKNEFNKIYGGAEGEPKDIENLNFALELMKRWINDFSPYEDTDWEILETQYEINAVLQTPLGRPYTLVGYVDALARRRGRLYVWEGKSGQQFWTPTQMLMDPQTTTYTACVDYRGEKPFGIVYNMLNTHPRKDVKGADLTKICKREETHRTDIELHNFLVETGNLVDKMYDFIESGKTARRSLKKDCDRCSYQDPCLLSMKGIPLTDLMEVGFKQKEERVKPKGFSVKIV